MRKNPPTLLAHSLPLPLCHITIRHSQAARKSPWQPLDATFCSADNLTSRMITKQHALETEHSSGPFYCPNWEILGSWRVAGWVGLLLLWRLFLDLMGSRGPQCLPLFCLGFHTFDPEPSSLNSSLPTLFIQLNICFQMVFSPQAFRSGICVIKIWAPAMGIDWTEVKKDQRL